MSDERTPPAKAETPGGYGPPGTDDKAPGLAQIDVNEYGGKRDGERQVMNRRLFMQLVAFEAPADKSPSELVIVLGKVLDQLKIPAVVYEDINDPRGVALLTWSEDPSHFVTKVRPILLEPSLRSLRLKPEYTMLGRTYSTGHEPKLEWQLLDRPREMVLNKEWPWAVWYPLRRSGAFAKLSPHDQSTILREHASIGMAYGAQDLAHDVRLACHGLDVRDNEFVIGLIGRDLYPLSHIVQTMRKTRQTSEFITQMGPFFVGYAAFRSTGA
jgi:chlorite dismutase